MLDGDSDDFAAHLRRALVVIRKMNRRQRIARETAEIVLKERQALKARKMIRDQRGGTVANDNLPGASIIPMVLGTSSGGPEFSGSHNDCQLSTHRRISFTR